MMVTIFENQTLTGFTFDSSWNAYTNGYVMPPQFVFKDGEQYEVYFNGNTFSCTAFSFVMQDMPIVAVGNGAYVGQSGNNEPFLLTYNEQYGNSQIFTTKEGDSHTLGIYKGENGIVLKDFAGTEQEYVNMKGLGLLQSDGTEQIYTPGQPQDKTVVLNFSNGDMTVIPDDGYVLTGVEILKPSTLVPENIPEGITIAGVEGKRKDNGGGNGDSSEIRSKAINFFDPFGNIIYSYTRKEASALTELPEGPLLEGFSFAGWTCTLDEIKSEQLFLDVAPYYSKDGRNVSILIVDLDEHDLGIEVCLNLQSSGMKATIDWGDDTQTTGITGSTSYSLMTKVSSHTYATPGIKYISVYLTADSSDGWGLGSGYVSPHRTVVNSDTHSTNALRPYYDHCLRSVLIDPTSRSSLTAIGQQRLRFVSCASKNWMTASAAKVSCCPALEYIATAPKGNECNLEYGYRSCTSLTRVKMQAGNSTSYFLSGCDSLSDLVINNANIYIPKNINYKRRLVINRTSVPNTSSNITEYRYGDGLIYVPDDAIETYKAHTVFAPVADCIRPISEYPDF